MIVLKSVIFHVPFLFSSVSILVLLDDRLKGFYLFFQKAILPPFQSLFYWMIVLKARLSGGLERIGGVSILVLLDDRLKGSVSFN